MTRRRGNTYVPDVAVAAMRGGRGTARATAPAGPATVVAAAPVTLASVDSLALPVVRVPLRAPDRHVPLELSAVITSAYDRGRYSRKLRYGAPPTASLAPADKAWAAEVAKAAAGAAI